MFHVKHQNNNIFKTKRGNDVDIGYTIAVCVCLYQTIPLCPFAHYNVEMF